MGYHRVPRKYFWKKRRSSVSRSTGGTPMPLTWLKPPISFRVALALGPFAPGVKHPVGHAGVAQIQPLADVELIAVAVGRKGLRC